MWMKKSLVSALFAAGMIAAVATPLPCMADVGVILVGPPAPRYEAVPAPRDGYIWSPGYYNYENNNHVWVNGEAVRVREGYSYQPNRWVQSEGHWTLERSHWDHN